jgi:HK97 family phage portal protein
MNVIDRLFGRRRQASDGLQRDASDDRWFNPIARASAAGVPVTVERALTLPVVYDCCQVLSQTIGALPWAIYERDADGSKRRRDQHPLSAVLADPNPETTAQELFGQMVFDLASDGNAFLEIEGGERGPISRLWRLDPASVTVERLTDRSRRYRVREASGTERTVLEDDMWHLRSLPLDRDGLRGTSRIHTGREEIGAALALRDYANRFFANDATPPFVLHHPSSFKDDTSRQNYLAAIKRWWTGARRHSPGVLEYGIKIEKVGVNNEEAQFLETRKELNYSIAQLWRMPPHKVGMLERATNNNIEHQGLEFVTDTLLPWLELIEQSIGKNLILNGQRFFFEFNVAGLLRGDLASRYTAYAQGRQWGWLSVNDIRRLENMNPVPGGDVYLQPLNMMPAGSPPPEAKPSAEILGPDGRAVSRIYGGNVVRLAEHRRQAAAQTLEITRHAA